MGEFDPIQAVLLLIGGIGGLLGMLFVVVAARRRSSDMTAMGSSIALLSW